MAKHETKNLGKSLTRTLVPLIVGLVITALADLGIDLDEASLREVVHALVTAGYYVIARFLEEKAPSLGWLLGYPTKPDYAERAKRSS